MKDVRQRLQGYRRKSQWQSLWLHVALKTFGADFSIILTQDSGPFFKEMFGYLLDDHHSNLFDPKNVPFHFEQPICCETSASLFVGSQILLTFFVGFPTKMPCPFPNLTPNPLFEPSPKSPRDIWFGQSFSCLIMQRQFCQSSCHIGQ